MPSFQLRCRGKQGVYALTTLTPASLLSELIASIAEACGGGHVTELKHGFPPKLLYNGDDERLFMDLESLGVANNELILYELSLDGSRPARQQTQDPNAFTGAIIQRKMADDNSCLFSAIGYLMERKDRGAAQRLRKTVTEVIRLYPQEFTPTLLERPVDEYCSWIQERNSWGGAIELRAFSRHYGKMIIAFDIVNDMIHCFGEDENFTEFVMVMYNGVHYDALVGNFSADGDESSDITSFHIDRKHSVTEKARALMNKAHQNRAFTDTTKFTLRCATCMEGMVGEQGARKHMLSTGHTDFTEY